jgi:hypothetical protein
MYIPAFIEDDEIIDKLNEKGIRVVSQVYRRVIPGTQVADGTRFMRCVFPPNVVALPWTIPFKVGKTLSITNVCTTIKRRYAQVVYRLNIYTRNVHI